MATAAVHSAKDCPPTVCWTHPVVVIVKEQELVGAPLNACQMLRDDALGIGQGWLLSQEGYIELPRQSAGSTTFEMQS